MAALVQALDLQMCLLILSILLIEVKAEPPMHTTEPDQSTQIQQQTQQRYQMKEVIMYLTPSQIKALESGQEYIVPHPTAQPGLASENQQQQEHAYQAALQNEQQQYQQQQQKYEQQKDEVNGKHRLYLQEAIQNQPTVSSEPNTYEHYVNYQQNFEQSNTLRNPQIQSQPIPNNQIEHYLQFRKSQSLQDNYAYMYFYPRGKNGNENIKLVHPNPEDRNQIKHLAQNPYQNLQLIEVPNHQSTKYEQQKHKQLINNLIPDKFQLIPYNYDRDQTLDELLAHHHLESQHLKAHEQVSLEGLQQATQEVQDQIQLQHQLQAQHEIQFEVQHQIQLQPQQQYQLQGHHRTNIEAKDQSQQQAQNQIHLEVQHAIQLQRQQQYQLQGQQVAQHESQQPALNQIQLKIQKHQIQLQPEQHHLQSHHQPDLEAQQQTQNQIQLEVQREMQQEVQNQIQQTQWEIQHHEQLQAEQLSQLEYLHKAHLEIQQQAQKESRKQARLQNQQEALELQTFLPHEINLKQLEDHIKEHIKSQEFHRQQANHEQQEQIREIENIKQKEIDIANMDAHHETQQIEAEQVKADELIKYGQQRAQQIEAQIAVENLESFAKFKNLPHDTGNKGKVQTLFTPSNPHQSSPKFESGFVPIISNVQDKSNNKWTKEVEKIVRNNEVEKQKAIAKAAEIAKEPVRIIKEEIKVEKRPQELRVREVHVPTSFFVPYPKPVEVKMPQPFIVPVQVVRPVPVPIVPTKKVEVERPVPVEVEKIMHVPVTKNVYVPVDKPYFVQKLVPIEVEKKVPVPIHINKSQKYTIIRHVWKH